MEWGAWWEHEAQGVVEGHERDSWYNYRGNGTDSRSMCRACAPSWSCYCCLAMLARLRRLGRLG